MSSFAYIYFVECDSHHLSCSARIIFIKYLVNGLIAHMREDNEFAEIGHKDVQCALCSVALRPLSSTAIYNK